MASTPYIIGIAGGTGAGKTTVAHEVAATVETDITVISLDNYYRDQSHRPLAEREQVNYDHPDAIEWSLLVEHLQTVVDGGTFEMPQYDFEVHTRTSTTEHVDPAPVVVLEGIFSLYHDEVLELLDLPIYVQTDADVRILRRLQRDVADRGRELEGVIDQYLSTVKPMHEQFVEPTKRNADIIIPEGSNETAVDLVGNKIASELGTSSVAGRA